MPQMGLEVTEGKVAAVHVEVGVRVARDQPLMELETDKAITDVVAPVDGFVASIEATAGDTVQVGAVLLHLSSANGAPAPRQRVAPVARRAAAKLGLDLASLTGTGPRGRITLYDVENAASAAPAEAPAAPPASATPASAPPAPAASAPPAPAPGAREELTPTRRAIARRMTASQLIPQYNLSRDVDATHLLAQKEAQQVSVNDLLIQAIAETAARHPALATSYVDEDPPHLLRRERIDVGLAVASDRGLVVPVIRSAHEQGLAGIAAERRRLTDQARAGRLSLEQMTGAAITLSSLAGLGIDRFTAMVNPGESAIVAVGRTTERLVPRGRTIAIVPTMTLTLSFDHRVVDGAVGAAALAELAELLEGGMTWRP